MFENPPKNQNFNFSWKINHNSNKNVLYQCKNEIQIFIFLNFDHVETIGGFCKKWSNLSKSIGCTLSIFSIFLIILIKNHHLRGKNKIQKISKYSIKIDEKIPIFLGKKLEKKSKFLIFNWYNRKVMNDFEIVQILI